MSSGLAPGPGAGRILAPVRSRGGDRGRPVTGVPAGPEPLRVPARAWYAKDDVFGLCDTLARAERALRRAGEVDEAAQLAAAFDVLESGLT